MATDLFARKRAQSAALSVLPILLLSFIVIASMAILARSAFEHNQKDDQLLDQRRIENALENEAREFAATVQREVNLMLVSATEGRIDMERMSKYLATEHNADFIAVYSRAGKLLTVSTTRQEIRDRRLQASDELIARRRDLRTEFALRRIGMSSTLVDPTAYIAMAAINVNDRFEVVVTRRLEEATLTRIGRELLLDNLRFVETSPRGVEADELPSVALAWNRIETGAITLESIANIGFLGIVVVCIYGLLVFLHVRRITHDLENSEAAARHLAGHDSLSGLPNRTLFSRVLNQRLQTNAETGLGLAVMYLDLDKFKEVNDQHGHAAGDKLIVAVAERLSTLIRGSDVVARFGGDEFALIQDNVRSPADSEAMATRILETLRLPYQIDDVQVVVGVSIGISLAPHNAGDAATVMRYADVALYRAKQEGRNRFSFFEEAMNETLRLRQVIEADLRQAIDGDQLVLHYQPIYTADGQTMTGVEALVRWQHPTRGLIPPNEFIGVAEERGLISALGEWVLRRACTEMRDWKHLSVAVNVSPVQFHQRSFVKTVGRILEETAFEPSRLELEMTEGVLVEDADQAEAQMRELRTMGVRLALDDFGVGYSSLIYLRRFAFDKIKIDRSFLESMDSTGESAILVHSIVHLGRALGLQVLAEGVETEEQRRFLQAVGCQQLQGFYLSRPIPLPKLAEMLDKTLPAVQAA